MSGPWTLVFGRSRIGGLYTVKSSEDAVLEQALRYGLPTAHRIDMREASVYAVAYLDGAVVELGSYGFGGLPAGVRVIGPRAMRHLCLHLDLDPPTRPLRGELTVPSEQALREEFGFFLASPPDRLEQRARTALFRSAVEMWWCVRDLLGDDAFPPPDGSKAQARWPAAGEWGDANFVRGAAVPLIELGVSVAEAVEMRSRLYANTVLYKERTLADWEIETLVGVCRVGRERVQLWVEAGVPLPLVPGLDGIGVTPADVRQLRESSGMTGPALYRALRIKAQERA